MKKTVVVGMSGGVDSSVAALLLKRQGYEVIGLFMKNWEEKEEGLCTAAKDYEDVAAVCSMLEIPYYAVNFSQHYLDQVFSHFLAEYKAGYTPNPDILCNREVKFKLLLDKALQLGADYLATGHYAQVGTHLGRSQLLKAVDREKDQTYFIYTLKEELLNKVLFPIGALQKKEVREIAKSANLPTFAKKDSTGICFIGKRNFKEFLSNYLAITPGNFENLQGKVIGQHDGIAYYTIGQRKGLKIGGPGEAWFVVGKDVDRNVVIIEQGEDHPALYCTKLIANEISWIGDPPNLPLSCTSKIRYRQKEGRCTLLSQENGFMEVHFDTPQKAVTPRQSIVFYQNEVCLGGAIIHKGCN